jgi:uncharacterized phage protein (TIGR02220 family)
MAGWVKLHRIFKTWEWYGAPNHLAVFIDLLLHANYEDGKYRGISIPKGSLTTSSGKIADRTGLSRQQVRTVLSNLQSTSEITIKTTNKYSMISVTNWDKYQDDQPPTIAKPNKQLTTSKKLRNKETRNNTQAELVIEYFNTTLKRSLGMTPSNFKEINARLKEGHTVEQMKTLIDHVSAVWTRDPFWSGLIRPSTMFGGKFDGYLQEASKTPYTPIKDFFNNALKDMEQ